jgi:hypothetical protein
MGGDTRRCCCALTCYYCHADCCHSSRSKATITWDATNALAAYFAAYGNTTDYQWLAQYVTGELDAPMIGLGGTPRYWVTTIGGATVTAGYVCATQAWTVQVDKTTDNVNVGFTLAYLDDEAAPIIGGCCGAGGPISIYGVARGNDGFNVGDDGDSVDVLLSNNRCEHAPQGDIVVTGTLDPDATGNYNLLGTYGGLDTYQHEGGTYYIWNNPGMEEGDQWRIGTEIGNPASDLFLSPYNNPAFLLDIYNAVSPSTGTATAAEGIDTLCAETVGDQCAPS